MIKPKSVKTVKEVVPKTEGENKKRIKRGARYAKFITEITDCKSSSLPNNKIRTLESAMTFALSSGKKSMEKTMIFRNYYGFKCKQMTMKEIESKYRKTEAEIHTTRNECIKKLTSSPFFQRTLSIIFKDHGI